MASLTGEETEFFRQLVLDKRFDDVNSWLCVNTLSGRISLETGTQLLIQVLRDAPHDVVVFWMGECNCRGHLN